MRYVIQADDGSFLTPRRNTGTVYQSRAMWSRDLEQARVFNTKTAATTSANKAPEPRPFKAIPVALKLQTGVTK